MEKLKKDKRGITLVALVVTIVILLILAGVSLNLVLSNNGIIKKSEEARDKYSNASANEQEQLEEVLEWIDKSTLDWNSILADATANPDNYKHSEQSASNGDIGIGTDGKPVNLDLWTYEVINENEIALRKDEGCDIFIPGYQNSKIVDGKIIGKVPQYIKINGNSGFYAVTSMQYTFNGCTNLITAPTIPSSVTRMDDTFVSCTNLTTAPTIPSSVTNMNSTFSRCTSLTTAPAIPSSVTVMSYTFYGCTSLTTAPTIPTSVTDMYSTFYGCTSLTAAPTIPSSVTGMSHAFYGCTSLTMASEFLSSGNDMSYTFYGCTSLTTAPTIPTSVTNMSYTFYGCTSLTAAPTIPSSVTGMSHAFCGCDSLTTATTIPSSVKRMEWTFYGCEKLQGTIEINANPTSYSACFFAAATKGTGLVVTGSSTMLDELIATGDSSKITKG